MSRTPASAGLQKQLGTKLHRGRNLVKSPGQRGFLAVANDLGLWSLGLVFIQYARSFHAREYSRMKNYVLHSLKEEPRRVIRVVLFPSSVAHSRIVAGHAMRYPPCRSRHEASCPPCIPRPAMIVARCARRARACCVTCPAPTPRKSRVFHFRFPRSARA